MTLAAVLFDLDDTLHDDTQTYRRAAHQVAQAFAREHGVDAERLRQAYIVEAEAFWLNLTDRQLSTPLAGVRHQMWAAALRSVGVRDEELAGRAADDYNRFRKEHLCLFPGVPNLLAVLRARGLKLGLLTNGFSDTHREKITLLQLDDAFDHIFIADEVGMIKPDPRIFVHACERLGSVPQQSAMVGDRFDRDIRGGQAAGLYTVWLNLRHEPVPAGARPPSAIIYDITDVAGALPA